MLVAVVVLVILTIGVVAACCLHDSCCRKAAVAGYRRVRGGNTKRHPADAVDEEEDVDA